MAHVSPHWHQGPLSGRLVGNWGCGLVEGLGDGTGRGMQEPEGSHLGEA